MPKTGTWLTLVGAFDGDQRTRRNTANFRWPAVFLPSADDPDKLLKATLDTTPGISELLATELHKSADDLRVAINHIAGMDYHDFVRELASGLNLPSDNVRRALVRIWLGNADNRRAAEAFVEEFRRAVDGAHP